MSKSRLRIDLGRFLCTADALASLGLLAAASPAGAAAGREADQEQHRDHEHGDSDGQRPRRDPPALPTTSSALRTGVDLRQPLPGPHRASQLPLFLRQPLAIETEEAPVGADEGTGIGVAGKLIPVFVLDRQQVAAADLGRLFSLLQAEGAPGAGLAQLVPVSVLHFPPFWG